MNHEIFTRIPIIDRVEPPFALAGRCLFGAGLAGLGILGIIYADFALQWQPVPTGLPGRTAIAYATGGALLLAGLGLLVQRSARVAATMLAILLFAWVILLHLPRVVVAPTDVARWNGFAEIFALAAAALILGASQLGRERIATRIAPRLFAVSPLVFGLAHFVYADFTAAMVPAWLPERLFWAYFTGCAHIAGGGAILAGVRARLAAIMLGAMYATFALILHLPRVMASPDVRIEWTMLAIATALTGAAWIVAGALPRRRV